MLNQILIILIILASLAFFLWGKWRYDIVALLALFTAIILGLTPIEEAFLGFVHPVIILIFAMVILSKGLINAGVIDIVAQRFKFAKKHPVFQLAILTAFTAFLSAFINSMGALAFVIPIAIRMSRQSNSPLSMFLIPIAFASHFGGSITLIGSASNIIVSGFRAQENIPFGIFDFAPVALPVAVAGILFISTIGWKLIPKRQDVFSKDAPFGKFLTELKVTEKSSVVKKTIGKLKRSVKEDFTLLMIVRGDNNIEDPSPFLVLKEGDKLIIESDLLAIESIMSVAKLDLVWKKPFESGKEEKKDIEVAQVVIPQSSKLIGETAKELMLHNWYQVNLLALHHPGSKINKRIGDIRLGQGDILVIQGNSEQINRFIKSFNLLRLQEQEFHFGGRKEALFAFGVFATAVFVSMAEIFPVHIIFAIAALVIVFSGLIKTKEMYGSVDFSVIILLGAMLQIGFIFQDTGAAALITGFLMSFSSNISPEIALAVMLIASILLSDILSNATVAVLMAPIAISVSNIIGVSADPFLIAVAIGSASSYLSPVGHQSNAFVMGIGGYKFNDYWKLGLPLEIISFAVAFPLIIRYWPFY